jgi:hypothetical protein
MSGASKCWIAQNLGADRQASSVSDITEESSGWYWQFNRKQGYKFDNIDRFPNTSWPIISENSHWLTSNDPCLLLLGSGWRLPLQIEWETAIASIYRMPPLIPFMSVLRLHYAGYLDGNGILIGRGVTALYQLRNQVNNDENYKGNDGGVVNWNLTSKRIGASVRCLKD